MCSKCNTPAEPLGIGHLLKPFGKRLNLFFTYPFHTGPVTLMILYGLMLGIFDHYSVSNGIVYLFCYLPFYVVFLLIILLYCNDVFAATIKGDFRPPPVGLDLDKGFWKVLKQLFLLVVIFSSEYTVYGTFGFSAGQLIFQIITFFIPAMLILVLINGSLRSALNPLYLFLFIKKIGLQYCVLYIFVSSLSTAQSTLVYYINLMDITYSLPVGILSFTCQAYYLIIIYHLLGYVVLQYHDKLNYQVDYTNFLKLQNKHIIKNHTSIDPILKDAQRLLSEGKPDQALKVLKQESRHVLKSPDLAILFIKLLEDQSDQKGLRYFAVPAFSLLMDLNKIKEAERIYQKYLHDAAGINIKPDALFNLCSWYKKTGQSAKALQCGILFINEYWNDIRSSELHFECISFAMAELKDYKFAINLAQQFITTYPKHKRYAEVKKLEKLMAAHEL